MMSIWGFFDRINFSLQGHARNSGDPFLFSHVTLIPQEKNTHLFYFRQLDF